MAANPWSEKRVLISGVCGTVGKELLRQLILLKPAEIVGIDNNESALFFLQEDLREHANVGLYLCDIQDFSSLLSRAEGAEIILHSAAFKHVILCEQAPSNAIQTNILGVQNVIEVAKMVDAERVLFTSSDKAVNPTNVMGTSKLMGERLMTAANAQRRRQRPIFASTRFGNVLGSRGSVVPLFKKQIAAGGPVTLTDRMMTRFIMTLGEAAKLVMDSVFLAKGGEVFVTKMRAIRIEDLATVMIEELSTDRADAPEKISLKEIGSKPGEKLYEELMNDEETRRAVELDRYFSVLPAFRSLYHDIDYQYPGSIGKVKLGTVYNSSVSEPMEKEQLRNFLRDELLLCGER
jgi:FlaA1/EpsC-like NDP-sugar epimerase